MIVKPKFVFALALLLLCFSFCGSAQAKQEPRKTVLDYFLLLPNSFFETFSASRQERVQTLFNPLIFPKDKVLDIKNEYINFPFDSLGTLEVAVFRYRGRDLIATRRYYDGGGDLQFLRYEHNRWKDVTKQMMPTAYNDDFDYTIPRYGTTIRVTRDTFHQQKQPQTIYSFVWRRGRFAKL